MNCAFCQSWVSRLLFSTVHEDRQVYHGFCWDFLQAMKRAARYES